MGKFLDIVHYSQMIITGSTLLSSSIYSISILLNRRFQNTNNIFNINLCSAKICSNIYWLIFYVLLKFHPKYLLAEPICSILVYFQTMCTLQISLAYLAVSINRYCSVIYHTKAFFKRKQWIILCITIQWISGIILTLPVLVLPFDTTPCITPLWMRIYMLTMIVINPTIISFIIYIRIFLYVSSSSRRVQPSIINQVENSINNHPQQRFNRRDSHLIQYIVFMFCIFIGGWSPIYIYLIIIPNLSFDSLLTSFFTLWAQSCLLINIISLYIYNSELRKYLQNTIYKYLPIRL